MFSIKLPSELKSTKSFINSSIRCQRKFSSEKFNEFCDQVRHFITVFNQKIDEGYLDEMKTIVPDYAKILYIYPLPSNEEISRAFNMAMIANKAAKDIWFWNLSEKIRRSIDIEEFNHLWIEAQSVPYPTKKSPLPFLKNLLSPKSFTDLRSATFNPYTNLLSYLRVPTSCYQFGAVFDLTDMNKGKPLMLHLIYGTFYNDEDFPEDNEWKVLRYSYTRSETEWNARLEKPIYVSNTIVTKPVYEPIAHRTRSKCKL